MARTIGDTIDALGFGWCQVRVALLAGSIYAVGGELWYLFTVFPLAVSEELNLHEYERAALGSVVYMGMFVGNLTCTLVADNWGRRPPLLFAMALSLVSATSSAFMYTFESIFGCWFLAGLAYGIGVPSFNALCSETSPTSWRYTVNCFSMGMFAVATLAAVLCLDFYAPDLEGVENVWRKVLLLGRVSHCVYLLLAIYPGYVESAAVLAEKGKYEDAVAILRSMRDQNGRLDVDVEYKEQEGVKQDNHDWREPLRILAMPRFRVTALVICATLIVLNFVTGGRGYSMPYVLQDLDTGISFGHSVLFVEGFELVAYATAPLFERWTGRRAILLIYLSCTAAATVMLMAGQHFAQSASSRVLGIGLVHVGLGLQRFFITLGWTAAYTTAAEAFPPVARATSSGICIGMGRLGSIAAPWVFEHVMLTTGEYWVYFAIIGTACILNAALVLGYLPETKGVSLEELEQLVHAGGQQKFS